MVFFRQKKWYLDKQLGYNHGFNFMFQPQMSLLLLFFSKEEDSNETCFLNGFFFQVIPVDV